MKKLVENKEDKNVANYHYGSSILRKIRRMFHLTIKTLKFLTFQEDNPRDFVLGNVSNWEFVLWWCLCLIPSLYFAGLFAFSNIVPYVTVFGNGLIGVFIPFFVVLQIHHVWEYFFRN